MNTKTIHLESSETWPLLNILNEVCYGIRVNNFENTIGVQKAKVVDLMDRISKNETNDGIIIDLNDSEVNILKRSFEEVFRQIDEWEFQTRIGISIPEAIKIIEKIR